MNIRDCLQTYIAKNLSGGKEFKSADLYVLCEQHGFTHKAIIVACSRLSRDGFLKIVRTEKRKSGNPFSVYVHTGAEVVPAKKKRVSKAREDYLTADKRLKMMEEATVNLAAVFANIKPQHQFMNGP
ncbi:MAG: hypothetical protein WC742_12460 [Gallionellaceae bacterium]|jgi:hypothetical protein